MNHAFEDSPDNVFKQIAAGRNHPCAQRVVGANGLVFVTFVHVRSGPDKICVRCNGIMPLTFWQYNPKPATEQIPS